MRCPKCGEETFGGITCGEDGVYRWLYEYKMFINPAMIFMLWRMFLWAIVIGWIVLIPFGLIFFAGWDSLFAVLLGFAVTVLDAALVNKKSQSSLFEHTTRVLVKKWYNCLHLRQLFGYNLIYTNKEDFDFVWEYIKARIPEKCKVRTLF